eukprot:10822160-Heterocapsa_arctica.AAC.1
MRPAPSTEAHGRLHRLSTRKFRGRAIEAFAGVRGIASTPGAKGLEAESFELSDSKLENCLDRRHTERFIRMIKS